MATNVFFYVVKVIEFQHLETLFNSHSFDCWLCENIGDGEISFESIERRSNKEKIWMKILGNKKKND